ncbi:MAG: ATP-binding cassette domain-containing protein, partial [Acidobacteria bacterium]|nr:ATP-binding cassette domain-containing protein [Acidobacteriota bacterium]
DLQGIHPQFLRKKIVMIPQTVYLFSGTISENIACGNPDASMADVVEAARLADIHDHIKGLYLGYNQMISEDNSSFSGGQRLKIAFARLFLSDPEVIILDEASSALDVETEHLIMSNLKRRFAGKTIISIAHRLHTVRGADRIVVLDEGASSKRATTTLCLRGRASIIALSTPTLTFSSVRAGRPVDLMTASLSNVAR